MPWYIAFFPISLFAFLLNQIAFSQSLKLTKIWESEAVFMNPESVVFDEMHNCFYVGNFNDRSGFRQKADTVADEFISKVNFDGKLIELKWVDEIYGATGMAIHKDILYVVERDGLALININEARLLDRISVPNAVFLNDLVIDDEGIIYISDSAGSCIYRLKKGKIKKWVEDPELLKGVNGLLIDGNKLLAGTRGDNGLLEIDIRTGRIQIVYSQSLGGIDGIAKFHDEIIFSWLTTIRILKENGTIELLWDSENPRKWCADFCFLEQRKMIVGPTFMGNQLIAFKIE